MKLHFIANSAYEAFQTSLDWFKFCFTSSFNDQVKWKDRKVCQTWLQLLGRKDWKPDELEKLQHAFQTIINHHQSCSYWLAEVSANRYFNQDLVRQFQNLLKALSFAHQWNEAKSAEVYQTIKTLAQQRVSLVSTDLKIRAFAFNSSKFANLWSTLEKSDFFLKNPQFLNHSKLKQAQTLFLPVAEESSQLVQDSLETFSWNKRQIILYSSVGKEAFNPGKIKSLADFIFKFMRISNHHLAWIFPHNTRLSISHMTLENHSVEACPIHEALSADIWELDAARLLTDDQVKHLAVCFGYKMAKDSHKLVIQKVNDLLEDAILAQHKKASELNLRNRITPFRYTFWTLINNVFPFVSRLNKVSRLTKYQSVHCMEYGYIVAYQAIEQVNQQLMSELSSKKRVFQRFFDTTKHPAGLSSANLIQNLRPILSIVQTCK